MDYFFTEEQKQIRKLARRIADEKVVPVRAELDESETFPREIMRACADTGLFGVSLPESYGGSGGGITESCLVVEELSRACLGVSVSYAASLLGAYPILVGGSEELKKRYLPRLASGKQLAGFGLTEANAGSDASGIRTEARRDGNYYVLNGAKQWVTNGGEADIYSVIAITDRSKKGRGATGFVLEKGMEGLHFGRKEKKLGIRASATRELIFQDCRVPKENVIGREGTGLIIAMKALDRNRPSVGAQAIGVSQGAFDLAVAYAREREQFGNKIISFQAVQHMLADMAIQVEAARALVYAVTRYIDTNPKDFSKLSAIAKVFPSDAAMKVTIDALQIFGGYGYMREYPVEKMMRDAKILQIYEGTNQIQRNVIALELIKETASKKR